MRTPAPPPGLSGRELGRWMVRTGTWLSGTAAGGTLRQFGAGWESAKPVTPEQWYRQVVATPAAFASASAGRETDTRDLDLEAG